MKIMKNTQIGILHMTKNVLNASYCLYAQADVRHVLPVKQTIHYNMGIARKQKIH